MTNPIAKAIHRYVEWRFPGETKRDIARRGIAHYNCAVSIANCSSIAIVTTVALTIFGCIQPMFGLILGSLLSYMHGKTIIHLNANNLHLEELITSFIRATHGAPQTNEQMVAQKIAQQIQPTNMCSLTSWYYYMPKNFQGL